MAVALAVFGSASLVAIPVAPAESASEVRSRAQAMTQELADAETRLGEIDKELSSAEFAVEDAAREIESLQADVEAALVERYTNPDRSILLQRGDTNQDLRAAALLRLVGQGDVDAIDRYSSLRASADEAGERLARLGDEQETVVARLGEQAEELQAELVRLEELERRQREEAARKAEATRKAEEERLAALEATAPVENSDSRQPTATAPRAPSGSGFLCPVPGSTFIDSWGYPRGGGASHQGVDMMAPSGTPIYAPVTGDLQPNQNGLGGLAFYLHGDNGDTYYGAHMSAYGATGLVAAGTVIGYVGNTGDARYTAPHLHFEIQPGGGSATNPYPTVAAAC
jgi:murein DD-endopeptidase MepM/ murein hydrolase activator NlpD